MYTNIKEFLDSVSIDNPDFREQDHGWVGAIAGKNQGLLAYILRVKSKALYTHHFCHRLNLAVVACCGEQPAQSLITNIKDISHFLICHLHVKIVPGN